MMVCKGTGRSQLGVWTPCPGWFSLFGFFIWCNVKGSLWCMGAKALGLWGFPVQLPKPAWKRVGGCVAEFWLFHVCWVHPIIGEVELQIVVFLEGGWVLCAQTGNCGSSPWSSCWQFPACLYYHPCPSVHVDSLSSLPTLQTLIMKGWVFLSLTYLNCPY